MGVLDVPPSVNIMGEVLSVGDHSPLSQDKVLLMIDSGACMSTCPRSWCPWSSMEPIGTVPKAVTAIGAPLNVYGLRRVHCRSGNIEFELNFILSDITRPIVSVNDLLKEGLVPWFSPPACLAKQNCKVPLLNVGPLYYLPVEVSKSNRPRDRRATLAMFEDENPFAPLEEMEEHDGRDEVGSRHDRVCVSDPASSRGNPIGIGRGRTPIDEDLALAENIEEDDQTDDIEKGRAARGLLMPRPPSVEERERHCLTHVPYQKWCSICVQSRGRDDAHPTAHDRPGIPVLQVDYSFFRSEQEGDRLQPILIGIVVKHGYAYATRHWRKVRSATARSLQIWSGCSMTLA